LKVLLKQRVKQRGARISPPEEMNKEFGDSNSRVTGRLITCQVA